MLTIYYAKEGTNFYFLNETEYEVWMNVRELDFDTAINGESDAQIVFLYVTDKVKWGKDVIECDKGVYVFKSLLNHIMFAVTGDKITKRVSPLNYLESV